MFILNRFHVESSPDDDTIIITFINKVRWKAYCFSPIAAVSETLSILCLVAFTSFIFIGTSNAVFISDQILQIFCTPFAMEIDDLLLHDLER